MMADAKVDDRRSTDPEDRSHLSPENRRMLEWLDDYLSKPLTDEEHERWEERKRFAEAHPLTLTNGPSPSWPQVGDGRISSDPIGISHPSCGRVGRAADVARLMPML